MTVVLSEQELQKFIKEIPREQSVDIGPRTLVVYVDETGSETFADPQYPIFGFGGCAILGADYKRVIAKPWRELKRSKFGGATKPFHASELRTPRLDQIHGINKFVRNKFYRFGVVGNVRTTWAEDMDGHRGVALKLHDHLEKLARQEELDNVVIIFEESARGSPLIVRDFSWWNKPFLDRRRREVPCEVCFLAKIRCEPGLEVADLIAHTVGRQQRRWLRTAKGFEPDFAAVFHKVEDRLGYFIALASIAITPGAAQ